MWPAPGYYGINSYYGKRHAPTSGASTFHKGIDIAVPQGSEYVAVTNGTITFADFLGGGGYTVTLTDENKENGEIKYSYCHSDPNFIVAVGEKVYKGQIIGYVGSTGNSTGPHLHFEVRTGNGTYSERVNPIYYLPSR